MGVDGAFEKFKALREELKPRLSEIETEQDARFQIINRLLTEVLGWPFEDIKTEPHTASGYTDYLLSALEQRRFVIEAKRLGPLLIDSMAPGMRNYKVGGPALSSAADGIQQAARYCLDHGVNYAALTTGANWIAFIPMPGAGMSYQEGVAISFADLDAILDNFAVFYDLFSKEGVVAKTYSLHFAKAGGLSITAVEPMVTANRNEYIRLLNQSPIAGDLEPIFREFFGKLSAESDREMLIECFVETRESRFADASLEKIIQSVSNAILQLTTPENQLAQEIQSAVKTGRGETVSYVSLEQINQYFTAMGIPEPAIDHAISTLLSFRLIEPYDASDDTISLSQRVAIAHSGRMHYEMALTDPVFVGDMAFATPVRSTKLVDALRGIRASGKMGSDEWQKVQSQFIAYCFEQDGLYVRLPQDSIYEGQRQLRFDLEARWLQNREVTVDVEVDKASRAGFSHRPATVKWYRPDRGYGFADANLPQDVFFHRNNLRESEIDTVSEGDVLICDIAPGPKGKLHVIAIHSVQKSTTLVLAADSQSFQGIVAFFNARKGYGFIKADALAEDIYVSSKLLDRLGVRTLLDGDTVKVSVEPGRFGKGLIATSIQLIEPKTDAPIT